MPGLKRTREINLFRVMRSIWINRTTSRVSIAKSLGLDKSTVTSIVNEMMSIGLVHEAAVGESGPQGGRKPIHIAINKNFGCVIGVEIQPETYTVVAVNIAGEIQYSQSGALNTSGRNLVRNFLSLVERTRRKLASSGIRVVGVGVGVSGIINQREGRVNLSIPLYITRRFDFVDKVSERLDLPVFLDNDANCCAWGELAFHRSERLRNVLFVLVEFRKGKAVGASYRGIGVGLGIVVDGRVYYGVDSSAGEFRSAIWDEPNSGQFSLTDQEMLEVETNPDVRRKFITELSQHLAVFVNSFNFNIVFLGGDIEKYEAEVAPSLAAAIRKNWSYATKVDCEITFSSHGPRAVAYGAAGMFLGKLFTNNYPAEATDADETGGLRLLSSFLQRMPHAADGRRADAAYAGRRS